MKLIFLLIIIFIGGCVSYNNGGDQLFKEIKGQNVKDENIGKTFWIPSDRSINVITKLNGYDEGFYVRGNSSFKITSVFSSDYGGSSFYKIVVADGRKGFISYDDVHDFLSNHKIYSYDPVKKDQNYLTELGTKGIKQGGSFYLLYPQPPIYGLCKFDINKVSVDGEEIILSVQSDNGHGYLIFDNLDILLASISKKEVTYGWDIDVINKIKHGQIEMGMTRSQISLVLGSPADKHSISTANGEEEQWIYGEYPNTKYLFFENGTLSAVQN